MARSPKGAPMSGWWLDERAHAGDEHLDATYVAGYDRKAGYDPAEDVDALRRLGLGPGSSVLDLGAGTGVFARAVAPLCGRVVAVDVSLAMVGALRDLVAGLGPTNARSRPASCPTSTRATRSTSCSPATRLHQLPDFWKAIALDRIASVLAPEACCA